MRRWVLVTSSAAPAALVGGWSLAGSRQPPGYDAVRDTISALAARGATDSWIMTTALVVLGLCYLATAAGMVDAGVAARVLLGLGGLATIVVAASPQPHAGHVPAATAGFIALALWPAAVAPPVRRAGVAASALLLILLLWLAAELHGGSQLGLSERILAAAEALCPIAISVAFGRRGEV